MTQVLYAHMNKKKKKHYEMSALRGSLIVILCLSAESELGYR
jgi:hypothetical protein